MKLAGGPGKPGTSMPVWPFHLYWTEKGDIIIVDMSGRVLEHIAEKYKNVKEGVKEVMGGRILEYEAKTILNRGIAQGMERGIAQGKMELVDVMLKKGKSYEEISELTDIPIERLKQAADRDSH